MAAALFERRASGPAEAIKLSVAATAVSWPASSSSVGFAAAAERERVPRMRDSAEGRPEEKAELMMPSTRPRCCVIAACVAELPPPIPRRRRRREPAPLSLRRAMTPSADCMAPFTSPDSRAALELSTLEEANPVRASSVSKTGHSETRTPLAPFLRSAPPLDEAHCSAGIPRLSRARTRSSMALPWLALPAGSFTATSVSIEYSVK
mmetsp:Transcript_32028/g.101986  ORF Transcript_32028/g.101986 Transcript_32028/m.101986 type:complete len:207 (+) Transcript_32028:112-732(+)